VIGDVHSKIIVAQNKKGIFLQKYCRIFGVLDVHTHIRYNTMKSFIIKDLLHYADVGAGGGYITIEIGKKVSGEVIGIVYDDKDLTIANKVAMISKGNIKFKKGNILNLSDLNQRFDQVFCIDVLEHIEDENAAIQNLKSILRPTGTLVISVPTPLYPKYFGEKFANEVGHVRDGYTLDEMSTLLNKSGMEILDYKYNTKKLGKVIAKIWYKSPFVNSHATIKFFLHPFFLILAYLDKYTPTKDPLGLVVISQIKGGNA
jgi:2-polyprenyl-3-methyl-5-hydroxy-6-metoxy-1,4-benzoquinol methylase